MIDVALIHDSPERVLSGTGSGAAKSKLRRKEDRVGTVVVTALGHLTAASRHRRRSTPLGSHALARMLARPGRSASAPRYKTIMAGL